MRKLGAMLVLSACLPCSAYACSGTALSDVPAAHGVRAISAGQHYDDFDHLLRDAASGQALVCADDRCYPAIVVAQGHLTEAMRLQGCRIAQAATNEGGLERREIDTPGFDRSPDDNGD